MSIERLTRKDGRAVYVVRWYDSGRGSARRKRTFDRRKDAEFFDASLRRARQLGQLSSEVIGSGATLEEFLVEWWDTYAITHLQPGTLGTYTYLLDKWIVPYLGRKRLRDITRETIDTYAAALRADGAGAPTINRTLGVLQGVFHRAVEWRRLQWNPVLGVRRLTHVRDESIDARTPETVEAIRAQLDAGDAALVSVLAYEGLRPGEAFALRWHDILDDRGRARPRLLVQRAVSGEQLSTTKSQRAREPELFAPVAKELDRALPRPRPTRLAGARLRRQPGRPPPSAELAPPRLDPRAAARRAHLLPHVRPPAHLRDAAALRRTNRQRSRRPPRPRRPGLHRTHLRPHNARRFEAAPRPDRPRDHCGA